MADALIYSYSHILTSPPVQDGKAFYYAPDNVGQVVPLLTRET